MWSTVPAQRTILVVVHTVTTANRLLDVLPIFEADLRVQVVFTTPGTSAVTAGVPEFFAEIGTTPIPWARAIETSFDLVIAAGNTGDLHRLRGPLIILSHGAGYTKYSPGNRKSEIGNRKSEIGPSVYGLSEPWLVHEGEVVPDTIVLSHTEQLDRLAEAVPSAVPHAVVAGDPCYDRLIASRSLRSRYRAELGVPDGGKLVVVSSTWWSKSLFGTWPQLLRRLMAELPVDEYRVAAVLHPNTWFGHSPWQIRTWLADCLRAGLRLVHPVSGWGAAIIAADHVLGDHGAVTTYAASIGVPVLLGTFPEEDVADGSCVALLGKLAPRADYNRPLRPQLDQPVHLSPVADLVTSEPGESAALLRRECYRLMRLSEPDTPVSVHALNVRLFDTTEAQALYVAGNITGPASVMLTRFAADVAAPPPGTHLVAPAQHPNRKLVPDIVLGSSRPGCALVVTGDLVHTKAGTYRVTGDPVLAASARYLWPDGPDRLTVRAGARDYEISFARIDSASAL